MKRLAPIVLVAVALLSLAALQASAVPGSSSEAGTSRAYLHSYNLPSSGVALEGYCPVAYFAVDKAVRGVPEHTSTYRDVTYYFVSADAKAMFDREPVKYVPAYGGWCAFGMAVEDKFPVDPTNFKIVNGRLMLFLRNKDVDARDLWTNGAEADLVRKADTHWAAVTG